jgi:hypothetical protein
MQVFWAEYGFYLWALTTALVLIALIWLGWNTFVQPEALEAPPVEEDGEAAAIPAELSEALEGLPLMKATLGRTLQYIGLERYVDATGAAAFVLALANARGDGVVLSSSVRGGLLAKPLTAWSSASNTPLTQEELLAVEQARAGLEPNR